MKSPLFAIILALGSLVSALPCLFAAQAQSSPSQFGHPNIVEIDGTFYCYATTDGAGSGLAAAGLAAAGLPVVWKSPDFLHWSFVGSPFSDSFNAKYWAPSSAIRHNGRYYFFPILDEKITVLIGDSPEGPFRTLGGKSINKTSGWQPFPIKVGKPIDTEIFIDDEGAAYMVWAQRGIGKLKSDFSGFGGEQRTVRTKRGGYSEGPCLFKRKGIYYYFYTLEGHENYKYAYMMSRTSPLGPWAAPEQDIIASTDQQQGIYGPGHGSFFTPKGSDQWYFAYLEYGRSGTNRQAWVDKMNFNADGTIQPIQLTLQGVGALRPNAETTETNLAQGKSAIASSTLADYKVPAIADKRIHRIETYTPANALDASNSTRWLAKADDNAAWFQLDLGEARDIKRTQVYFVKPTAGHAYRQEHSLDGQTWQPYGGHDDARMQSPHTDAKAVRARYLRITFLKGTPGLWELRV